MANRLTWRGHAPLQVVEKVIGRALGYPGRVEDIGGAWASCLVARVDGPTFGPVTGVREMLVIGGDAFVSWHWEHRNGGHSCMMPDTPEWRHVGRAILAVCGGRLVSDNGETEVPPDLRPDPWADDGEPWDRLQQAIVSVRPYRGRERGAYATRWTGRGARGSRGNGARVAGAAGAGAGGIGGAVMAAPQEPDLRAIAALHPADLDLWAAAAARSLGRQPATGRRWACEVAMEGDSLVERWRVLRAATGTGAQPPPPSG